MINSGNLSIICEILHTINESENEYLIKTLDERNLLLYIIYANL